MRRVRVIDFVSQFMEGHPKQGQPTDFAAKIKSGEKIHTLRKDSSGMIREAYDNEQVLSLRVYTGHRKESSLIEAKAVDTKGLRYEKVYLNYPRVTMFKEKEIGDEINFANLVAKNSGLSTKDFWDWFGKKKQQLWIFHFTNYSYTTARNELIDTFGYE